MGRGEEEGEEGEEKEGKGRQGQRDSLLFLEYRRKEEEERGAWKWVGEDEG